MRRILQRIILMFITLIASTIIVFIVVQLPPGDYADVYAYQLESQGVPVTREDMQVLRHSLGLDQPLYKQYWNWISNVVLRGNWGYSLTWRQPVIGMIQSRIGYTILIMAMSLILSYGLAIPIGVYTAVRQHSLGDYIVTAASYAGMATPGFLLALVLLYFSVAWFDTTVGGLFSREFVDQPWSWAKVLDMLSHLIVPAIVLGASRVATLVRTMRALVLDELDKLYVTTARSKGLSEWRLLMKYPVRVALIPIVSTLGWELATIISGAPVVSLVLSLPDTGPLYLSGLLDEDIYLIAGMLLIYTVLTMIGTVISDILLMVLDPRARQSERS